MNSLMTTLRDRLDATWRSRAPRNQRGILLVAIVVATAWAQFLWYAGEQRQVLRQKIERLEYHKALAKTLSIQIAKADENGTSGPVSTSLPILPGLNVQTNGKRFQISGTVAFDTWLVWVGEVQQANHVVLNSARLRKAIAPGHVQVEAEMESTP